MRRFYNYLLYILLILGGYVNILHSENFIPADNPNIQYFGRWDFSDSLYPKHSWPGVYIYAEFSGKSIGIRMFDSINYYNVYIDGKFYTVLHGNKNGEADYKITDTLDNKNHSIKFSKRNIVFDAVFPFSGLLLDDGARLLPPPPKPKLRIEFIGDSYTAGESDEATVHELTWEERYPVTNIDKGFAVIIANHYNADYCITSRSGCGMVCDWQGNFNVSIPKLFNRTLMESPEPKWDFRKWIPSLAVIALGLNDYSGLKDKDGNVTEESSAIFRKGYHEFITTLRTVYHGVKILAVAPYTEWIRNNVRKVVKEEKVGGKTDIYYAQYDYFPGGYVGYGHPTAETHKKMADQLIETIDSLKIICSND